MDHNGMKPLIITTHHPVATWIRQYDTPEHLHEAIRTEWWNDTMTYGVAYIWDVVEKGFGMVGCAIICTGNRDTLSTRRHEALPQWVCVA